MKRLAALAALAAALGTACGEQSPIAPTPPTPSLDIVDGHSDPIGHPQFFFKWPIRPLNLEPPDEGFNSDLRPVVEIFECTLNATATGCALPLGKRVARLTMDDPSAIDRLYVLPNHEEYAVLWRTGLVEDLNTSKFYRIIVKVGSEGLGVADVDIVATKGQLLKVDRDDFVPTFDEDRKSVV